MAKRRQRGRGRSSSVRNTQFPFPPPIPPSVPLAPHELVTPENAKPDWYLTKKEVCARLKVSDVRLREFVKLGLFPASRVIGKDGGRATAIRWLASEVFAAMANAPRRLPGGEAASEACAISSAKTCQRTTRII